MSRRLIGVDLAWSKRNGTGCVELAWEGRELRLDRVDLRRSTEAIANWIKPGEEEWVVAVDAPLVICNQAGSRAADQQPSRLYHPYEAGAYPANLNRLGKEHRGGQLLRKLTAHDATLVEAAEHITAGNLVFETYPHVVMVELFRLSKTIKYKKGRVGCKRRGQQELAEAIRVHLCGEAAEPRLRINDALEKLLREPVSVLKGEKLKEREDKLDAVICAYTAAWLDAGRPLQGLGEVGAGVMITPSLRGICPPFG